MAVQSASAASQGFSDDLRLDRIARGRRGHLIVVVGIQNTMVFEAAGLVKNHPSGSPRLGRVGGRSGRLGLGLGLGLGSSRF